MVYTAPATIRSEYDPTEQTVFTTTFVYPDDNAVVIKARDNKENRLTTFHIFTKVYDQDAKKYVESTEQEEKADKIVLDSFDEVDTEISLKYINKDIKKQKEKLQAGEVAETRIEHVKANIEDETKTLREEKVQELETALGINVDKVIEGKENIVIESVELKKTGTSFWLAGTPVMNEDEDVQFD